MACLLTPEEWNIYRNRKTKEALVREKVINLVMNLFGRNSTNIQDGKIVSPLRGLKLLFSIFSTIISTLRV